MIITEYQAIVAITLTIHLEVDGNRVEVPVRWTVVMRRESDRWVWLHRHASSAASDQAEGQAYPQGNA
jgi:ketosteroid isomerase-like protein